ncbi:MAG: thiosulfate sulfurtransferase [Rhodospirillales bacterium]|nr:thiosulfate sulfurtransferase [Rhodospirillales bacterium]
MPRRDVRMVLCAGAGDGRHCAIGAERLQSLGYTDIRILAGGIEAWQGAGFELFSGVHVPSKAFGEFVETTAGTPHIQATDIEKMRDAGEDFVILDSRPFKEYHLMNIPGAINVPGAELVYRIDDLAPDPNTRIIVNCAGRTRSIIGAQSLINAGVPNPVAAIENGTMGWHLAGLQLERRQERKFDALSLQAHLTAMDRAIAVRERFGIRMVDSATADDWAADQKRTTFFLDVRDPGEFAVAHRPGSKSAPGGQLVQATDHYVGVRRARLVLIDNDSVRATMTASWLIQMGWDDVFILFDDGASFQAPAPPPPRQINAQLQPHMLTAGALIDALKAGEAVVVDMATSIEYRDKGHIPGSWFAIRSELPGNLAAVPDAAMLVLTSPDGTFAELVYADAVRSGRDVKILDGGTGAWSAAGQPLEYGFTHMADPPIDLWYKPYEFDDGDKNIEQAMEQYLTWEVDLVGQIERDGTTEFRIFD